MFDYLARQCPTKILTIPLWSLSCTDPNIYFWWWWSYEHFVFLLTAIAWVPLFWLLLAVYSSQERPMQILTTLPWLPSCADAYVPKLILVAKLW